MKANFQQQLSHFLKYKVLKLKNYNYNCQLVCTEAKTSTNTFWEKAGYTLLYVRVKFGLF